MLVDYYGAKRELDGKKCRSAWKKGVKEYAYELLEELEENYPNLDIGSASELHDKLVNGAENWKEYSWGGCSYIYDSDIAERLCTASELKRTHDGEREPNSSEQWLDVQARALFQAAIMVRDAIYDADYKKVKEAI